jgi:small-conductance mechanosensitive channel
MMFNENLSSLRTEKIALQDKNRRLQNDLVKGNEIITKKVEELKRSQNKCQDRKRLLQEQTKTREDRDNRLRRLEQDIKDLNNTILERDREIISLKNQLMKLQAEAEETEKKLEQTDLTLRHLTKQVKLDPVNREPPKSTYVPGSYTANTGGMGGNYSTFIPKARYMDSLGGPSRESTYKSSTSAESDSTTSFTKTLVQTAATTSTIKQVIYPQSNSPEKFK